MNVFMNSQRTVCVNAPHRQKFPCLPTHSPDISCVAMHGRHRTGFASGHPATITQPTELNMAGGANFFQNGIRDIAIPVPDWTTRD